MEATYICSRSITCRRKNVQTQTDTLCDLDLCLDAAYVCMSYNTSRASVTSLASLFEMMSEFIQDVSVCAIVV